MIINTNMPALKALTQVNRTNKKIDSSNLKMATGLKINSVSDDASGFSISNKIRNEINGLEKAAQNALDGVSLIQTADGVLDEVTSMLQRMRELCVKSSNDTLTDEDKEIMQSEINSLSEEIDSISDKAQFNKTKLFGKKFTDDKSGFQYGKIKLQIGAYKNDTVEFFLPEVSSKTLGTDKISVQNTKDAQSGITSLDNSLQQISNIRGNIGALQNRLESTHSNIKTTNVNLSEALSRIVDTDMAKEMSLLTQNSVISQAGISVLAQANQKPQQVLQLLG